MKIIEYLKKRKMKIFIIRPFNGSADYLNNLSNQIKNSTIK